MKKGEEKGKKTAGIITAPSMEFKGRTLEKKNLSVPKRNSSNGAHSLKKKS